MRWFVADALYMLILFISFSFLFLSYFLEEKKTRNETLQITRGYRFDRKWVMQKLRNDWKLNKVKLSLNLAVLSNYILSK